MYNEICVNIASQGWTKVSDPCGGCMGPFAYKGNQWVSFDDLDAVTRKAKYIQEVGLGGAMFWDLPSDDFRNLCGGGTYPLIRSVHSVLSSSSSTSTNIQSTSVTTTNSESDEPQKVICYYPNWPYWRKGKIIT